MERAAQVEKVVFRRGQGRKMGGGRRGEEGGGAFAPHIPVLSLYGTPLEPPPSHPSGKESMDVDSRFIKIRIMRMIAEVTSPSPGYVQYIIAKKKKLSYTVHAIFL